MDDRTHEKKDKGDYYIHIKHDLIDDRAQEKHKSTN